MPRPQDPNPGPAHRPQIPIDWNIVDKMLNSGSSGQTIAAHLGICDDTLYERTKIEKGVGFSVYAASKRAQGEGLLRLAQFQGALKGNPTMLIHLGKHMLDQWDKNAIQNTPPNDTPIQQTIEMAKEIQSLRDQKQELMKILESNGIKFETNPVTSPSDEAV